MKYRRAAGVFFISLILLFLSVFLMDKREGVSVESVGSLEQLAYDNIEALKDKSQEYGIVEMFERSPVETTLDEFEQYFDRQYMQSEYTPPWIEGAIYPRTFRVKVIYDITAENGERYRNAAAYYDAVCFTAVSRGMIDRVGMVLMNGEADWFLGERTRHIIFKEYSEGVNIWEFVAVIAAIGLIGSVASIIVMGAVSAFVTDKRTRGR